jgi:hypothetical protein
MGGTFAAPVELLGSGIARRMAGQRTGKNSGEGIAGWKRRYAEGFVCCGSRFK